MAEATRPSVAKRLRSRHQTPPSCAAAAFGSTVEPDEGAPGFAGPPSVVHDVAGLAGALFPGFSWGTFCDVTVVGPVVFR